VITLLIDHNLEGQALLIRGLLSAEGWLDLVPLQLQTLADAGLPVNSNDRTVWRFAQAHAMLLLTDNRSRKGADSLEETLRDEAISSSLPVLTIGTARRLVEPEYRRRCVERLLEIVLDLERYAGVSRLFIP
jgi:hypothetical protein